MPPSAELRARVLEAVGRERSPTRSETRLRNAALLASGVVVPLSIFLAWGGIRQTGRPDSLILETSIGAAVVALVAGVLAAGRGRSMLGRSGALLLGLALATPFVLLTWKVGVSSAYPGGLERWPTRAGFRCLNLSCQVVGWPLVAFVLSRRGSDPRHPRLLGAAAGAAIGSCAWVMVDLWCPVAYIPHLFLGHVLPLVATTLVGAFVSGPFLALRR